MARLAVDFLIFLGGFAVGVIALSGYWLWKVKHGGKAFAWSVIRGFMITGGFSDWVLPGAPGIRCPECGVMQDLGSDDDDEGGGVPEVVPEGAPS